MYDPRLARMFKIDPRSHEYPWQSTYAYHRNSPIATIDYLGGGEDDGEAKVDGKTHNEYVEDEILSYYNPKKEEDALTWDELDVKEKEISEKFYEIVKQNKVNNDINGGIVTSGESGKGSSKQRATEHTEYTDDELITYSNSKFNSSPGEVPSGFISEIMSLLNNVIGIEGESGIGAKTVEIVEEFFSDDKPVQKKISDYHTLEQARKGDSNEGTTKIGLRGDSLILHNIEIDGRPVSDTIQNPDFE